MVVLAQALVSQPKVVLVDELSLGLAPVVVKRLVPTLAGRRRQGRRGAPDRAVRPRGSRARTDAYVIEGGQIRYAGAAQALKDDPALLHSAYLQVVTTEPTG